MIFYNQTSSPQNEISYHPNNNSAIFNVNLNQLPSSKMQDLAKADDNELYTNVLEQFSQWLKHLQ